MRTARATLAGPVIAAMIAGSAMGAAAHDEESPTPAFVAGTVMELTAYMEEDEGRTVSEEAGVIREEGHVLGQRVRWSDPRLPSEHWVRVNLAIYDEDAGTGALVLETSHLLVDDEGAWRGTGRAFANRDDRHSYFELVGEDAYDGLHAFLRGKPDAELMAPWDVEYEGWIFEGEVPDLPEPAEPAVGEGMVMRMVPDPDTVEASSDVAPADPMAPAAFVFRSEQMQEPEWGTDHESAGGSVSESRGVRQVEQITATDPRASGVMTTSENRTQIESDTGVLQNWSMTARLANDGGAWSGPVQIVGVHSPEFGQLAGMSKLTGEGGYDGLTLFMHQAGDHFSFTSWGLIVPNELLAPMPDPVGPAEE